MAEKQAARSSVPVGARSVDEIVSDIDRVMAIIRSMPVLKRYSDDDKALKEAAEILEGIKGKL